MTLVATAPPKTSVGGSTRRRYPLTITATSTEQASIYSLSSKLEITHRSAAPCALGKEYGLIAACTRALSSITHGTLTKLLKDHIESLDPATFDPDFPPLLPVEIRTDSAILIECCEYLRAEPPHHDPEPATLRAQLIRFDVLWQLLPTRAAELQALERWAELECRPGTVPQLADNSYADRRSFASRAEADEHEEIPKEDTISETHESLEEDEYQNDLAA